LKEVELNDVINILLDIEVMLQIFFWSRTLVKLQMTIIIYYIF